MNVQWLTKNLSDSFKYCKKKKKKKNQILKLLKDQKILKNCLEIIETKQNIYDKTIEKYKRNMSYIQKNNPWLSLLKGIKRFITYKL